MIMVVAFGIWTKCHSGRTNIAVICLIEDD